MAYRAHVDAAMDDILRQGCDDATEAQIELGLHHEQQHQELILTDIKHALFSNPLLPAYAADAPAPARASRQNGSIIPAGWWRSAMRGRWLRLRQ